MVWIVNVGTLALRGDRHPDDWARVGEDQPNTPVVTVVRALIHDGNQIRYMSGRMEQCRHATVMWLRRFITDGVLPAHLWMRANGDMRPDDVVKRELYEEHVRGLLDVEGVIARDLRRWHVELGLTVFQCNPSTRTASSGHAERTCVH